MDNRVKSIKSYMPMNNKKEFFLDTNVLYWYCYPRYSVSVSKYRQNDINLYYQFVDKLVQNGNPILTSIYNVSELLNVIEKNECDIYQKIHPEVPVCVKDLRNMRNQRNELKQIMRVAINNVYQACNIFEFGVKRDDVEDFVNQLDNHKCDFFDYTILKNNVTEKNINVITDDADFASVGDIEIYTANDSLLRQFGN